MALLKFDPEQGHGRCVCAANQPGVVHREDRPAGSFQIQLQVHQTYVENLMGWKKFTISKCDMPENSMQVRTSVWRLEIAETSARTNRQGTASNWLFSFMQPSEVFQQSGGNALNPLASSQNVVMRQRDFAAARGNIRDAGHGRDI